MLLPQPVDACHREDMSGTYQVTPPYDLRVLRGAQALGLRLDA